MSERDYLGEGPYGQKVVSGASGPGVVYFDGRPRASGENLRAARKRWLEANGDDFDELDGYLVDKGSGRLYKRAVGDALIGENTNVELFFIADGTLVCLEPSDGPATLRELERATTQAEDERARDESSAVALADVEACDLPTLQEAARIILEEFRGRIEAKDGWLVISMPEFLTEPGGWDAGANEAVQRRRVGDAAAVLMAARTLVLRELGRRGRLDPNRLPDR